MREEAEFKLNPQIRQHFNGGAAAGRSSAAKLYSCIWLPMGNMTQPDPTQPLSCLKH